MVTNENAVEVGELSPKTSRNVKVRTSVTVTLEALRAYQREQGENYSFYPTVKIRGSVSVHRRRCHKARAGMGVRSLYRQTRVVSAARAGPAEVLQ